MENFFNLSRLRCKLPDDDMKMSKHVAVEIIYCYDIYYPIFGYNKTNKRHTVHVAKQQRVFIYFVYFSQYI